MNTEYCSCPVEDQDIEEGDNQWFYCITCNKEVEPPEYMIDLMYEMFVDDQFNNK